jgi:acyl dehydratase
MSQVMVCGGWCRDGDALWRDRRAILPGMGFDLYWEDFAAGTVREFGGRTVSREEIVEFARQFDPQPFHLDDEAARKSLFGGLCASGWHTAALTMRMMCDAYLNRSASLGSPGIENLRWTRPVYPGDTLRVRMTVLQARPMASKPDVGLMLSRWEVFNQHDEPVLTMEGWGMMRRRDPAASPPSQDEKR